MNSSINILLINDTMWRDQIYRIFASNTKDSLVISTADGYHRIIEGFVLEETLKII